MKILYLSVHSILEHDELTLFTEMGHEIFSLGGAYENPTIAIDVKRPAIKDSKYQDYLIGVARQCTKDNIHPELIDWADIIYVMHRVDWIENNWYNIKDKTIVWRSIGQSTVHEENRLKPFRDKGLKIVRYSPKEETIPEFVGSDAVIRFYKDPEEFKDWNGQKKEVVTIAQQMKSRGEFLNYTMFDKVTRPFERKLYGPGNEDSGLAGGFLTYPELKEVLRDSRVYFYAGTQPASYTLGFIEALMTGTPIVSIGPRQGNQVFPDQQTFEIDSLIKSGTNGFWAEDIPVLQEMVGNLLNDDSLAQKISEAGRKLGISIFGKDVIKLEWERFFATL